MTTAAETRAATLAKLREHPGFAEVWGRYQYSTTLETDEQSIETLITMAYEIGCIHGIDRSLAVLGKPREVA